MKLSEYLRAVDKDAAWFADQIGVDPVSVRRYISGSRRPEWRVIARIKAATGGVVTADDFIDENADDKSDQKGGAPVAA